MSDADTIRLNNTLERIAASLEHLERIADALEETRDSIGELVEDRLVVIICQPRRNGSRRLP